MDKIKNEVTKEVKDLTKEDYLSILEFLKNHAGEEYSTLKMRKILRKRINI